MLKFVRINKEQRQEYEKYYQQCPEKSSDTAFINLWAWDKKYQTELAFDTDLCWLRFKKGSEYIYGPPQGSWDNVDFTAILSQIEEKRVKFTAVPEELSTRLQKIYGQKLEIRENRDNWEYIYKISDLIKLEGEKYRNQRKLSNQFLQNKNYRLENINEQNKSKIAEFQKQWMKQEEIEAKTEGLQQEDEAINKVLQSWADFSDKLLGFCLEDEEKIVGYSIVEKQDDNQILIHFEKALYAVRGSYPALNKLTLENFSDYTYVNREQDLGIPGLRRMKEEYNPIRFIKKYQLILTRD